MSSPATVPMFDPTGTLRDVPYEQMHDAISQGGKMGVYMKDPQGKQRVVPADMVQEATRQGGTIVPYNIQGTQPEKMSLSEIPGAFLKKGAQILGGGIQMASQASPTNPIPMALSTTDAIIAGKKAADSVPNDQASKIYEGMRSISPIPLPPEKMAMALGGAFGIDTPALAEASKNQDYGRMAVEGGAPLAVAAGTGPVTRKLGGVIGGMKPTDLMPGKQGAVMPEAANLPPAAVSGTEKIFRAAAPTGANEGFRANLYSAAGDLAEIGKKINLAEAKGGIINPDMRVRATVNALTDHMQEMYQNEVKPQFEVAPNAQVSPGFTADAQGGLKYMSKVGTVADRGLAGRAMSGEPLTLDEAYQLARNVNKQLLGFESMTPAEKAAAVSTSRNMAGLKAADGVLSQTINQTLKGFGQPGIEAFERRYGALASIREQLSSRMNAVELNQPGAFKAVAKPLAAVFTGGKTGIASASQAAVADVNIGKMLQNGFQELADSGISANRAAASQANIRGLIGSGSVITPQPTDISGSTTYSRPAYSPTTRAARLGLLLPEKSGAPLITPPPDTPMTPGEWLAYTTSELRRPAPKRLPAKVSAIPLGPSKR